MIASLSGMLLATDGGGIVVGIVAAIAGALATAVAAIAANVLAKRRKARDDREADAVREEAEAANRLLDVERKASGIAALLEGEGDPTPMNLHPREGLIKQMDRLAGSVEQAGAASTRFATKVESDFTALDERLRRLEAAKQ